MVNVRVGFGLGRGRVPWGWVELSYVGSNRVCLGWVGVGVGVKLCRVMLSGLDIG